MPTREISSRDVFLPHAVNYGKSIDTQTIIFAWHLVAYFLLVSHEGQAMTFFSETKKKEILSTSCELQGGSCLFPTSTKLPFTSANRSANNFFFKKVVSVVRLLWHWQSDSIRVLFTASSFFVYFRVKHPTIRQSGMLWRSY